MRVNILRSIALMLSVCIGGLAQAQYGAYSSSAYNYSVGQGSAAPVHPSLQQGYRYQPGYQFQTVGQQIGGAPAAPMQHQPEALVYPVNPPQHTVAPPAMTHGHQAPMNQQIVAQPASNGCANCNQPAPAINHAPAASYPVIEHAPAPVHHGGGQAYTYTQPNIYVEAAAAPTCGGSYETYSAPAYYQAGPTAIRRGFASANILFLTRDDNYDRPLLFDDAAPSNTRLRARDAELDFSLGYDVTIGSYLGCGKYFVSATWLQIDGGDESRSITAPAAGSYRANFRNWDRLYYDRSGDGNHTDYGTPATDESLYSYFDRAVSYNIRRESNFYGAELNFGGFGIGGAARAGRADCGGGCGSSFGGGGCGNGCGGNCGNGCNSCGNCNSCCPQPGCGGACGPMVPSCCCKLQTSWTLGIRWFHFDDSFAFSSRSERTPAAPSFVDTFTYQVDTENEMLGFQLGGNMSYCCGCRTQIYGGAKVGIYGNDASLRQRFYSTNAPIYITDLAHGYPNHADQVANSSFDDTTLASLAEFDLGVGYRFNKCWTVRGGYRFMAASGVATALGNIVEDPANASNNNVWANQNLILHGGYVGMNYNW